MDKKAYLSFRVGREWYGIPVEQVIEILPMVGLNDLPGAQEHVLGLMTLRQKTIPVIDLRRRFNLAAALTMNTPIIAIHTAQKPLALVVDEVDDVRFVSEEEGDGASESPYLEGVVRLDNEQSLLLLNTEQLT